MVQSDHNVQVDQRYFDRAAERAVEKYIHSNKKQPKQKMEFSKKLIIWAFIFYAVIGVTCLALWVLLGDWPYEIALFFVSPIVGIVSYMFKSGYENKAKIQKEARNG